MTKKFLRALAFAGALLASTVAPAASPKPAEVTLTVQADKPGARIDANIYGQFMEHLGRNVYEGIWVGEGAAEAARLEAENRFAQLDAELPPLRDAVRSAGGRVHGVDGCRAACRPPARRRRRRSRRAPAR